MTLGGDPLPGVTLHGFENDAVTDSGGRYAVVVGPGYWGNVTPVLAGHAFDPPLRTYAVVSENLADQDYTASPGYRLSGTVTLNGAAHQGVLMAGLPTELRTGPSGYYEMMLPAGWDGTVTPTLPGFSFSPAPRTYTDLSADMPAQDYTTTYAGVADDVFEDNDSFGTAAVVPMGTIIPDLVLRDQDWFKFYISGDDAGKTLGVRLTATSFPDGGAYADPNLLHDLDYGIMDSTGKLIHHSMSGDVDEVSFIPDIAEGWYYIAHHYVVNPGMVYSLFVVASNDLPVGTISGRVTDGADQGIDGVTVELWGLPFDWNKSRPMAVTDSDGYYKIASFSGDYLAQVNLRDFNQNPADGLPDGWLPIRNFRASSYDYQKIVTVIPGTPVTGADVVLEPGGTISGRVTDGQGNPLHLAIVTAYNANAGQASYAYTDADGHYAILRLRTANYGIGFCPPTGNTLGREWYGGGSSFAGVRPVAVTAGATTSGIDAALEEGAYVSGRVADAGDNPIQGVQVTAHDVSGIALQSAVTQADGTYLIGRLPGGSVKILFNAVPCFAGNYFSEWYTDKRSVGEADPVLVTVGQTTTDIDAVLSPAGAIAGRLTDNDGKGLLSGYVSCVGEDGSYFHGAQPDHEGNYVVRNLPPNNYRVRFSYTFSSITNYPPEWYPEANRMEEAGLLAVGPGETVNGIDGMLEHDGGVIPGRVTNASGTGLAGLMVMASEQNWGGTTSAAMTDANGYYTVLNVPQGTAKVLFNTDASNSLYASEYYNNKPDFGSADTISVGIPDIDALLAERAALTVTTTSLAAGQVGVAYDQPLAVTGGRTFYHWTVSAGALPDGLTMGARGRITGMPTMAGTFNFTARVSDSTSPQQVTTKDLSITVGTYTGEGYTISGTVLFGGQPLAGVVLAGLPGSPVTNAAGGYVAVVQAGWAATVTPTLAGYGFTPPSIEYVDIAANQSGQDYAARLLAPALTVASPNGGESWSIGSVQNVTWIQTDLSGSVAIDLYKGGVLIKTLGTPDATAETFPWTISATETAGNDYRIRVWQGIISDESDTDFALTTAAIRKDDLVGTWDGQGVYYRDSDTGAWVQMASPATMITTGDIDNDGTDDLIGIWPSQGGVWVKYYATGEWVNLSSTAVYITTGDMNGDGRVDLLGTWDGQGVYYRDSATGAWVQMSSPASMITCGDLDNDGTDDLIGIWAGQGGVWVKYSSTGGWEFIGSTPSYIGAGDMNGDGRDELLGSWTGQGVYYRNSVDRRLGADGLRCDDDHRWGPGRRWNGRLDRTLADTGRHLGEVLVDAVGGNSCLQPLNTSRRGR